MATLGVSEDGTTIRDEERACEILEERNSAHTRTLWLNRPKALHAHTLSMLKRLHSRLIIHENDPEISCIILRSTGKRGRAFCAGGDIVAMYGALIRKEISVLDDFFRSEYLLNHRIGTMKTCVVSIWDGIVMGGGVGLSVHGKYRIATENTIFAMPECSIGLHPDAGASHALPRVKGGLNVGKYLALTGARVHAQDTLRLGLATHFVESGQIEPLVRHLQSEGNNNIEWVIDFAAKKFNTKRRFPDIELIQNYFRDDSVEEIIAALENCEDGDREFADETLAMIRRGNPISLKVALESVIRAQHLSLAQCLDMEYRLTVRFSRSSNFQEGIRAAVIDKKDKLLPRWNPETIEGVSDTEVERYFSKLDVCIEELRLAQCERSNGTHNRG